MPYNRFATALRVHFGGPGNMRALSRELVKMVDEATDAGGTDAAWSDPAVSLMVAYLATLTGSLVYPEDALVASCQEAAEDTKASHA